VAKRKQQCPEKAYRDTEFLNSPEARVVRMLAEYLEPLRRFEQEGIGNTIVFFGSARLRPSKEVQAEIRRTSNGQSTPAQSRRLRELLEHANMARYYDDAVELARLLMQWSNSQPEGQTRYAICTGGSGGIMEAANRGAIKGGGPSVGLNISLPFEQLPNEYITEGLCFEFHYFFMRKLWFALPARALVAFPGGFGTFDELFEVLTLVQTGKLGKHVPIVIYGTEFWEEVIDFKALARRAVIGPRDLDLVHFSDEPSEAFEYLKTELTRPTRPRRRLQGKRKRKG